MLGGIIISFLFFFHILKAANFICSQIFPNEYDVGTKKYVLNFNEFR